MATVINNPSAEPRSEGGMGFLVGVILLIIFMVLFFYYGLPALRSTVSNTTPSVSVPKDINVNVNTPNK